MYHKVITWLNILRLVHSEKNCKMFFSGLSEKNPRTFCQTTILCRHMFLQSYVAVFLLLNRVKLFKAGFIHNSFVFYQGKLCIFLQLRSTARSATQRKIFLSFFRQSRQMPGQCVNGDISSLSHFLPVHSSLSSILSYSTLRNEITDTASLNQARNKRII